MRKLFLSAVLVLFATVGVCAQEVTLPEKPARRGYVDYSAMTSGFFAAAQVSPTVFFGDGDAPTYLTQLDFVAGYRLNEFFKVGLGVSPKISFKDFGGIIKFIPVYLDLRGNFIPQEDRMFSPYWNLDAGYTFNAGFMVAPTLGLKFGGLRNNFLVGLGYTFQSFAQQGGNGFLHGVVLRLGYEF